ncbi:hypothetical protein [Poseidonibacter lekithochrous]|uniref:hypothetical protein n=1 Tax=Poseidonibacter lekithochrous TaxID=1904463 RepID=UPI0008FC2F0D|nr:hypothetical protein [Poseidonibacter lekithochrous]QKJ23818.1 putative membrane protein [Poseidonibacter lekithochrous]
MNNIYFKIIRWLTKQEYELKARYIPALIFTSILLIMVYFKYLVILDLGWIDFFKIPIIVLTSLFLSLIPKFCATAISGYLQTLYWDKFGNTIIKYLKKSKNNVYQNLLNEFDDENILISNMLKMTREDRLLFSKNIFYGFMRNFSFLVVFFLFINIIYFDYFIFENIFFLVFSLICLYISSQRYAEQIIKSYIEIK